MRALFLGFHRRYGPLVKSTSSSLILERVCSWNFTRVVRRTIWLICGAYQRTIWLSVSFEGSAVLNCLTCRSILKALKVPASVVTSSCATTLEELDPLRLSPVTLLRASNSIPHVLPTASGKLMPSPLLGLNLQIKLSMQFQSRSYVTKTDIAFPLKVKFTIASSGDNFATISVYVSLGYPVISSRVS